MCIRDSARVSGVVERIGKTVTIAYEEAEERVYEVAPSARIKVEHGQVVSAGEQLTDGSKNPQDVLRVLGKEEVQRYMVAVSYTHLRAHETRHDLVCRLLLEKKKKKNK